MSSDQMLLVFGAGGHGRVVVEAALAQRTQAREPRFPWRAVMASDRDPARCLGELLPGVSMATSVEAEALIRRQAARVHVAIGSNVDREAEVERLVGNDAGQVALVTLVHPMASIATSARLADGCFVAAQAVVSAGATLGRAVVINHAAVVDHDCRVAAFAHIAPRAVLGGAVVVGAGAMVGSGAVVLPEVRLGDGVVLGAGAVLTRDAHEGTWVGVPARRLT